MFRSGISAPVLGYRANSRHRRDSSYSVSIGGLVLTKATLRMGGLPVFGKGFALVRPSCIVFGMLLLLFSIVASVNHDSDYHFVESDHFGQLAVGVVGDPRIIVTVDYHISMDYHEIWGSKIPVLVWTFYPDAMETLVMGVGIDTVGGIDACQLAAIASANSLRLHDSFDSFSVLSRIPGISDHLGLRAMLRSLSAEDAIWCSGTTPRQIRTGLEYPNFLVLLGQFTSLHLPVLFLGIVFIVVPIFLFAADGARRRRRRDQGRCVYCGYCLRGLTVDLDLQESTTVLACPECGTHTTTSAPTGSTG